MVQQHVKDCLYVVELDVAFMVYSSHKLNEYQILIVNHTNNTTATLTGRPPFGRVRKFVAPIEFI